jgi:hypothetical protein
MVDVWKKGLFRKRSNGLQDEPHLDYWAMNEVLKCVACDEIYIIWQNGDKSTVSHSDVISYANIGT